MYILDVNTASPPLFIVRIEVERLFGKYTYILTEKDNSFQTGSSPIILYGDNGSGKTTILKLLFHLLSPTQRRGHHTFLAKTPFFKFSVFLADGTRVAAIRKEPNLIGDFQLQLSYKDNFFNVNIEVESDYTIQGQQGHEFYRHLSEIRLNLFFLGDDRVLNSDIFEHKNLDNNQLRFLRKLSLDIDILLEEHPNLYKDTALKASISRTEEWIREQALRGANKGAENVHSIYEEIITRIIQSSGKIDENLPQSSQSLEMLINELKSHERRSQDFSHFGLMSPLNTQKIVQILQSNNQADDSIIRSILKPYLDSVAARFDALQNTQDLLTLFESTINKLFLRDKYIKLHLKDGLKILTDKENELSPEMLSSGEKQLLLLFCNTLTARDKATIFIIDEPEISLNIKWQRQLIRALLDLTKGGQVQFIIATHSIELLSQYNSSVVKLRNMDK